MEAPITYRVLFLYTELAPYFLACLKALVNENPVEVELVRWPVNNEAPFDLDFDPKVNLRERKELNDADLLNLYAALKPHIVLTSGWVDKTYLQVCREAMKDGVPAVMCSDTAWRGDLKQWAAVAASKLWIKQTFSDAWVSGMKQAQYAKRLGFQSDRIQTGFYSADTSAFKELGQRLLTQKAVSLPHRFLCVARYIPTKGHQYLCEAFAELCDGNEAGDWELWCVGTGELFPLSYDHDRIVHKGFVQPIDLPAIQEECSVFVLPSLYEPWGVVVQEHALSGFPLLLSDKVGAAERFLKEGENGYVFKAGSKEDLKNAMRSIIGKDDRSINEMGERSSELGADWDPSKWAKVLMKIVSDR